MKLLTFLGFKKKMDEHKDPWRYISVRLKEYYTEPGMPTKDDIKITKKYATLALKEPKDRKVLILGATPRLRDLFYKLGCKVTVCDINKEMIMANTLLMKENNKDEKRVVANWLKMPFPKNHFDMVTGDLLIPNIPHKDRKKFYSEIKRVLKQGGYFLTRLAILTEGWKRDPVDKLIDFYVKRGYKKCRDQEMFCHILHQSFNPKTKMVDSMNVMKLLKKYWDGKQFRHKDKGMEKMLNRGHELWKPYDKKWSYNTEKDLRNELKKFFMIIRDNLRAKDHTMAEGYVNFLMKTK